MIHLETKALNVSAAAMEIHSNIVQKLTLLENGEYESCIDKKFRSIFDEALGLIENYQQRVLEHHGIRSTCQRGCATCCFHWVEDINSFEMEMIVSYLKEHCPERIDGIVGLCEDDKRVLEMLDKMVATKLYEAAKEEDVENIDPVDLLLGAFYQMRRPCPLLDNGECLVYTIRPMTCRIYMSFSPPSCCDPAYINECDTPTYLLDVNEDANEILDRLHFKYLRFESDSGLRSLLPKYIGLTQK